MADTESRINALEYKERVLSENLDRHDKHITKLIELEEKIINVLTEIVQRLEARDGQG